MSARGVRWHRPIAVIGAARTPYCRMGGALSAASASHLAATVAREATARAGLRPRQVDALVLGSTRVDPERDLAREVALEAGLNARTCSATVCAGARSSARAIVDAAGRIALGEAEVVAAGGVDRASERRSALARLWSTLVDGGGMHVARGLLDRPRLRQLEELRERLQSLPRWQEAGTGEGLAVSSERVAQRRAVSRSEQDAWALRSHRNAADAAARGAWDDWIAPVPVRYERGVEVVAKDDGCMVDDIAQWSSRLPPLADAEHGTVTVGNLALPRDGAAMLVLADASVAEAEGWPVVARLHAYAEAAVDPFEHAWLGAVPAALGAVRAMDMDLHALDAIEVHEPSAAAVVAFRQVLADPIACRELAGSSERSAEIDVARVNAWGGAIALGNPVGAIAAHHVAACIARLHADGGRWGLVAVSDAGGAGHALVLEISGR